MKRSEAIEHLNYLFNTHDTEPSPEEILDCLELIVGMRPPLNIKKDGPWSHIVFSETWEPEDDV